MRLAIFSDAHGNFDALKEVIKDINSSNIDAIISLGDNIGYGPESDRVIKKIKALNIPSVQGNHELAVMPERVMRVIQSRCDPDTGLVKLDPVPVEPGDKVRVFDGPLAGLEGIFRERKSEKRAILLMKMLGTETNVEVDTLLLQKM